MDIFISANQENVNMLIDRNIIKKENAYDFLSNALILVKSPYSKSEIKSVEELKKVMYILLLEILKQLLLVNILYSHLKILEFLKH